MYSGEQLRSFRKHWNHTPDDAKELKRFLVRVNDFLRGLWNEQIRNYSGLQQKFALISGTPYSSSSYGADYDGDSPLPVIFEDEAITLPEVLEAILFVFWTLEDERPTQLKKACESLNVILDASPGIDVRLVHQNGKAFLLPLGALLLDEAVIDDNLVWLENYPEAAKPFQEALKIYTRKDPREYRSMLDNLRMSVEQIIRAVLRNQKSLENQKEEFLQWLSAHDAHSQITNMFGDLLFGRFAIYQNDAVKHHEDKYTVAEVEFVLYWTGIILRFIQRASEQQSSTVKASSS